MISISCVVTAPGGMAKCLLPDDLLAQADGVSCEIVVVDGAASYTDQSRPGLRHLWVPGTSLYGLMTTGVRQAAKEWVLIFEDHGRPMPGLLEAYRTAIRRDPDIDLFGGALENATSTSPWSFATFLYGSHAYWAQAHLQPRAPTNANLIVRRSAIRECELALESGFMFKTVRRLVDANRYRYCPSAVVDHVVDLTFRQSLETQFHCTRRVTTGQRQASPRTSMGSQLAADGWALVFRSVLVPIRIMLDLHGTERFRWSTLRRLFVLGLASASGVVAADVRRHGRGVLSDHRSAP